MKMGQSVSKRRHIKEERILYTFVWAIPWRLNFISLPAYEDGTKCFETSVYKKEGILYAFFWVIPWRLNFTSLPAHEDEKFFETSPYKRRENTVCVLLGNSLASEIYKPACP